MGNNIERQAEKWLKIFKLKLNRSYLQPIQLFFHIQKVPGGLDNNYNSSSFVSLADLKAN